MRQKRPLLVAVSLSIHLVVVLGLFIAGFWKIEQLDAPRRTIDLAVAPPPPPAPSGSPSAGEHEPFKKKKPARVIPKVITQPEPDQTETEKPTTTETPSTGDGGTGTGSGSGSGTDPKGTGDCVGDHCGPAVDTPAAKEPVVEQKTGPHLVIPEVIKGMRLRGQTQIQMPDLNKTSLMRAGKTRANATVKVCVSASGSIMSVDLFRASGLAGWDAAILAAVRKWEYQAHRIGKTAVPVCGMVTFLYEIR